MLTRMNFLHCIPTILNNLNLRPSSQNFGDNKNNFGSLHAISAEAKKIWMNMLSLLHIQSNLSPLIGDRFLISQWSWWLVVAVEVVKSTAAMDYRNDVVQQVTLSSQISERYNFFLNREKRNCISTLKLNDLDQSESKSTRNQWAWRTCP